MDPVITGISAWQYWTTPPVIGEVDLPEGIAFAPHPNGVGLRPELRCDRGNARELDALVAGRLSLVWLQVLAVVAAIVAMRCAGLRVAV